MPKLVDQETGETVMDELRVGELQQLEDDGLLDEYDVDIDWDLPEEEFDVDEPIDAPTADESQKPDELVKTDIPMNPDEVDHRLGEDEDENNNSPGTPDRESYHYDDVDIDEMDEVANRDETEIEHNYDIDIEVIEKVDTRDRARWARLVRSLAEYGDDIERRKRERDERIAEHQNNAPASRLSDELRRQAERTNVIKDLKEGFRKLVSRPVPRPATHGPQMDQMNVVRRAAGDMTIEDLFEERVEVETGERCIGLCTDISGSMRSDIDDLKIAGGAIAEATKIIGDKFVWEAFTDRFRRSHSPSHERLDLRIVTGPNEQFDWKHLDSFDHANNTATPSGIRDTRMLMEQTNARQYVMIVITDGMANVTESGEIGGTGEPVEQARQAVEECRADGIDVIGLGIGSMSDQQMETTFGGGNYQLTNIEELAETILGIYKDQMNVQRSEWR